MKINSLAFIFQMIASLSYLLLFFIGIGYPFAYGSLILFLVRLFMGIFTLINSKKTHYLALSGSVIGIIYLALTYAVSKSLLLILPFLLEVSAACLTLLSASRVGKTKQPSPLDMPVYG